LDEVTVSTDRLKHFGFLIKDLSRRYVQRFEHHAQETSLTLMQCKVLVHLERSEGVSQARLAELTDMDPMTMVRILDRMEADKMLERRSDPADRRARRLYLTKKSKPLLDEVWRLVDITRMEMFSGLSKSERDTFMRVLEQVHDNACALDEPQALPNPVPTVKRTRSKSRIESRSTVSVAK
jgi:DNA-binding MarR family transcriptional regulator